MPLTSTTPTRPERQILRALLTAQVTGVGQFSDHPSVDDLLYLTGTTRPQLQRCVKSGWVRVRPRQGRVILLSAGEKALLGTPPELPAAIREHTVRTSLSPVSLMKWR